jgi:P-type Cu+ transporter
MSSRVEHTDPICGMQVEEAGNAESSDYQGRTYYFCSRDCRAKFEENPEPFAGTPDTRGPTDNRR